METEVKHNIYSRTLAMGITTHCNLRCPECAASIPRITSPEHYDIEYIQHAASYFFGIEHLWITGGEPTMHPEFRQLVPLFKDMFGCHTLTLATNGYNVIEYADVLHHFDGIHISHYQHNHQEVTFIAQNFTDICPQGPTRHICIARRAIYPKPCAAANQYIKYVYDRLYPCCSIPWGLEGIGIPLTSNWREEILEVPLPCADCFVAEEEHSLQESDVVNLPAIASTKEIPGGKARKREWPYPPDDIVIYGLDGDSWMQHEASIRLRTRWWATMLKIVIESYAPGAFHPIILTFKDEKGKTVYTHMVHAPGTSEARIRIKSVFQKPGYAWIKVLCDTTFIPHEFDPNNPDTRELGVRVASLRYG